MSGITVKNAAAQSKIILLLAVVWLIMAVVTGRHRKATIVIYAGIGALFEVLGLYSGWAAIQSFSQIRMMDCSMIVLLVLLFLILAAVIILRNQPDKERDNGSENSGQDSSGGFG